MLFRQRGETTDSLRHFVTPPSQAKEAFGGCVESAKNEKGIVAIETLVSFIGFLMVTVIIILFVNLAAVQTRVHYALTQTAKETAVYSYLFDIIGVTGARSSAYEQSRKTTDELNQFSNNTADVYDVLSEGGSILNNLNTSSLDGIISSFEDGNGAFEKGKNGATGSYEQIKDWASDPGEFFGGLLKVLTNKALDTGMDALFGYVIAPALFDKYMRVTGRNSDARSYLSSMGVKMDQGYNPSDPKKGLTFTTWEWAWRDFVDATGFQGSHFLTKGNEITLQATYYYDLGQFLRILPERLTSLEVVQKVQVKAWVGDGQKYKNPKKDEKDKKDE